MLMSASNFPGISYITTAVHIYLCSYFTSRYAGLPVDGLVGALVGVPVDGAPVDASGFEVGAVLDSRDKA